MVNNKSTFVTVIAWISIFFSGFGLLVNIMQNIMLNTVFPAEMFRSVREVNSGFGFYDLIFSNLRIVMAVFGLLILFFFLSSIGLLKRREWARKSIIVFLCVVILYILVSSIMSWMIFFDIGTNSLQSGFATFEIVMTVFMFLFVGGTVFLCGWIIWRLMSEKIRLEFKQTHLNSL